MRPISTLWASCANLPGVTRDPDDDDEEDTDRQRRPTAAELRHHRRTVPGGIPALDLDAPPVLDPPFDWPLAADPVDAEVLRRAGRDPTEPAMPAEISAIIRQLDRRFREAFEAMVARGVDPKVLARISKLEVDFEPHRRFGKWVAGVAATALVAVGVFLYHRGQDEQHVTDELQRLGALVDKLEHRVDQTGTRP